MKIHIKNQLNNGLEIQFCCGDKEYSLGHEEEVTIEIQDEDVLYLDTVKENQEVNALASEIASGGDFNKFLVFKIDDVKKYLGEAAYAQLSHTLAQIAFMREKEGKPPATLTW